MSLMRCFHCQTEFSSDNPLTVSVNHLEHPVCSDACHDTVNWIVKSKLAAFYQLRGEKPAGNFLPGPAVQETEALPDNRYLRTLDNGHSELHLLIDGVHCSSCVWLIERLLFPLPGVQQVQINAISRQARIVFDSSQTDMEMLLEQIRKAGYQPQPQAPDSKQVSRRDEQRQWLKYLMVAGFGMMQTMMFTFVLYVMPDDSSRGATVDLFRWLSLLVVTPVLFYSGRPFFNGALRALTNKTLTMDVPVALSLLLIYGASVWQSIHRGHDVYFDTVGMFIFFLLIGRYLELRARHRAIDSSNALARTQPTQVARLDETGEPSLVAVADLAENDLIQIPDGASLPVDGLLESDATRVDESLLSGEHEPQLKKRGDLLIAGSLIQGKPATVRVTRTGEDTVLAGMQRLAARAQTQRPNIAKAGEKMAARFISRVLTLTVIIAMVWAWIDPSRILDATIALLVVTCPCAFSLAVPTVVTRALQVMNQRGMLVTNSDAVEKLSLINRVIFDKTGTLTLPTVVLESWAEELTETEALQLAASLSRHSQHPLSRAFLKANQATLMPATSVQALAGLGITGEVAGRSLHLGRPDFALADPSAQQDAILLAENGRTLARFRVQETLRPDAKALVRTLQQAGIHCQILSGDSEQRVQPIAEALGINDWQSRQLPADKFEQVQQLRAQNQIILMVGDGSNDAPVLAAADVSVAMASGTDLAHAHADVILCSERLMPIHESIQVAHNAKRILAQNQRWALSYNLIAMTFAAAGLVPAWLAAIGMSTSSLVVVLNAMRVNVPKTPALEPLVEVRT